ncbi:MAG: hypothetical protein IJJ55_06155 [Clostridia bacterium]|nr:hypothetical protein [Clostridia bacterium]
MADISSIKLPNDATTYNIKDATARSSIAAKQDALVSGTNIKTLQATSLLGSGNLAISNAASAVTISPTTDTVYSMTSAGSVTAGVAATLVFSIDPNDSGQLNITFTANTPTAVTLPSRSAAKTVWTGYNSGVNNTYAAAQAVTLTGQGAVTNASGEEF